MTNHPNRTRAAMITRAESYIVVNDGQYRYPVLRSDLRPGDTEAVIRAMSPEQYGDWCQSVPADQRVANVGTRDMSDLCAALIDHGAEIWEVG